MSKKATEKQILSRNKNISKGTWKKGQSGNPKGRPLKILSEIKKYSQGENIRIAKADLARIIEILISKPQEQLNEWLQEKNTPAYIAAIITAIGDAVVEKNFHKFRQIIEMLHGKPEQIFTVKEEEIEIDPNMSDDKAAELFRALVRKR